MRIFYEFKDHISLFLFGLSSGALACALIVLVWLQPKLIAKEEIEIISSRKPILVTNVVSSALSIELGEKYPVTFHFEKTRIDCQEGRVIRHMWEQNTGVNYLIEDIPAVPSDIGYGKFTTALPTVPLLEEDMDLMRPGLWSIKSLIRYRCPRRGSEDLIWKDEPFSTPLFEVREKAK